MRNENFSRATKRVISGSIFASHSSRLDRCCSYLCDAYGNGWVSISPISPNRPARRCFRLVSFRYFTGCCDKCSPFWFDVTVCSSTHGKVWNSSSRNVGANNHFNWRLSHHIHSCTLATNRYLGSHRRRWPAGRPGAGRSPALPRRGSPPASKTTGCRCAAWWRPRC